MARQCNSCKDPIKLEYFRITNSNFTYYCSNCFNLIADPILTSLRFQKITLKYNDKNPEDNCIYCNKYLQMNSHNDMGKDAIKVICFFENYRQISASAIRFICSDCFMSNIGFQQ